MPSKANEVREVACRALCCKIVVPLLVASVVVVDHADGAGAADGRRILHHGEQLCLTVVRKGVADGHRHHVVHVLLHTIITAFGPKISPNRPMRSSKKGNGPLDQRAAPQDFAIDFGFCLSNLNSISNYAYFASDCLRVLHLDEVRHIAFTPLPPSDRDHEPLISRYALIKILPISC